MRQRSDLELSAESGEFRPFMTAEEYYDFQDRFQKQVGPELDRHAEARQASEKVAREHYVH
ncbi:MAG: hypothetical protein A2571_02765 [Candidatus Vogelbacteria bacterium RIFOXYD1_FULL_44_32]|uniref:Uncharacterized protein n=1 Tax=Candidatus Vogelbacteria bacterium RIFOXYD1_FULL_44_32 TaxID=1802438 RepID=A0A1G2QDL1_9BACT|nr:MAG: hypothetical protein A2571_02765 [Candidatus Vogelbacteria bacterium RIFOXYD1_FULL_44_32]